MAAGSHGRVRLTGPAESMTSARAALAEWNPKARRMMRRTRWLRPSSRALASPRQTRYVRLLQMIRRDLDLTAPR